MPSNLNFWIKSIFMSATASKSNINIYTVRYYSKNAET